MRLLTVIDNYDSFTYNLVQEFGRLGESLRVWRNDEKTVEEILAEEPDAVILSPGPCTPNEAGISLDLVEALKARADSGESIPVLGVCLGHQTLAAAFGGEVVRAPLAVHGKASRIYHDGTGLFGGLEQGFLAGRYHSLLVREESLGPDWHVAARTGEGMIMGMHHKNYPFYGVQFHPESILTPQGEKIIQAFLAVVQTAKSGRLVELRKESGV